MNKKNNLILALIAFGLFYFGIRWKHKFDRPWAYSNDPGQSLLLGKWEGDFHDPDGIAKHMAIEIDEPEEDKYNDHYRTRRFDESETFEGRATITSKQGTERDRIKGGLGSEDWHDIEEINFIPLDESKQVRESFNVSYTSPGGKWKGDTITTTLIFVYRTKTGSGYSDSSDPRYKKHIPITLHRIKQ